MIFLFFCLISVSYCGGTWTSVWENGSSHPNNLSHVENVIGEYSGSTFPSSKMGALMTEFNEYESFIFGGFISSTSEFSRSTYLYHREKNAFQYIGGGFETSSQTFDNVFNESAFPGARIKGLIVKLESSHEIILGFGEGHDENDEVGFLCDMWIFNTLLYKFRYYKGSLSKGVSGNYELENRFTSRNFPGGRKALSAIPYPDNEETQFLLAFGYGHDEKGNVGYLNDFWVFDRSLGEWKFLAGEKSVNYRTSVDNADPYSFIDNNYPGGREGCSIMPVSPPIFMFALPIDYLLVFGGKGIDENGNERYLNDMWLYNITGQSFRLLEPSSDGVGGHVSVYAAQRGVSSSSNVIGGRSGMIGWKSSASHNKFYFFGGYGYASSASIGYLNDLWLFDYTTNMWTFVMGGTNINTESSWGDLGVVSPSSTYIGGRSDFGSSVYFNDDEGTLFIFGGSDQDGEYSDIWRIGEEYSCFSEWNPIACGGENGKCVGDNNECLCYEGVETNTCQEVTCFGFAKNDTQNVCNGRGTCLYTDVCNCEVGFYGDSCEDHFLDVSETRFLPIGERIVLDFGYGWDGLPETSEELELGIYNRPSARENFGFVLMDDVFADSTASSFVKDNLLFVYGGKGRGTTDNPSLPIPFYLSDVWCLNLTTERWLYWSGSNESAMSLGSTLGTAPRGTYSLDVDAGYRYRHRCFKWKSNDSMDTDLTVEFLCYDGDEGEIFAYSIERRQWKWLWGNDSTTMPSLVTENNTYSALNWPGDRITNPSTIIYDDNEAELWVFGGRKLMTYYNDIWVFSSQLLRWKEMTNVGGSVTANLKSIAGAKNEYGSSFHPGGRKFSITFCMKNPEDNSNLFYVFGGRGCDSSSCAEANMMKDVWVFSQQEMKWKWVSGDLSHLPDQNLYFPATSSWESFSNESIFLPMDYDYARNMYFIQKRNQIGNDYEDGLYIVGGMGDGYFSADTNMYPTIQLLNVETGEQKLLFGDNSTNVQNSIDDDMIDQYTKNNVIASRRNGALVYLENFNKQFLVFAGYGIAESGSSNSLNDIFIIGKNYSCFGISSDDFSSCNSEHGRCVGENLCLCDDLYTGKYCELLNSDEYSMTCNGLLNPYACNGGQQGGRCIEQDVCECNEWFYGENCDYFTCPNNNCSYGSLGMCIEPGKCECYVDSASNESVYFGDGCEYHLCFGFLDYDEEVVCSGHGDCLSPHNCSCSSSSYHGSYCQEWKCDNIDRMDSTDVCNHGKGECVAVDTCECVGNTEDGFWDGEFCELCQSGYTGITCLIPLSNDDDDDDDDDKNKKIIENFSPLGVLTIPLDVFILACIIFCLVLCCCSCLFVFMSFFFFLFYKIKTRKPNAPLEPELCFVFTDIKDSTKIWNECPREMKKSLKRHDKLLRKLLRKYNGFEVKTIGDAFFVAFRDPVKALKWSCEAQTKLLKLRYPKKLLRHESCKEVFYDPNEKDETEDEDGKKSRSHSGDSSSGGKKKKKEKKKLLFRGLTVRIGMHSGRLFNRQLNRTFNYYDFIGRSINKAARVEGSTKGGHVYMSHRMFKRVRVFLNRNHKDYWWAEVGGKKLKGFKGIHFIHDVLPIDLKERSLVDNGPEPIDKKTEKEKKRIVTRSRSMKDVLSFSLFKGTKKDVENRRRIKSAKVEKFKTFEDARSNKQENNGVEDNVTIKGKKKKKKKSSKNVILLSEVEKKKKEMKKKRSSKKLLLQKGEESDSQEFEMQDIKRVHSIHVRKKKSPFTTPKKKKKNSKNNDDDDDEIVIRNDETIKSPRVFNIKTTFQRNGKGKGDDDDDDDDDMNLYHRSSTLSLGGLQMDFFASPNTPPSPIGMIYDDNTFNRNEKDRGYGRSGSWKKKRKKISWKLKKALMKRGDSVEDLCGGEYGDAPEMALKEEEEEEEEEIKQDETSSEEDNDEEIVRNIGSEEEMINIKELNPNNGNNDYKLNDEDMDSENESEETDSEEDEEDDDDDDEEEFVEEEEEMEGANDDDKVNKYTH